MIDVCRSSLPRDTLATADSGAHRILLSQMWECYEPRGLIQSSALCTMGCAIPLAMGVQFVEPNRTVVSFCGDAGFLMVAGELATAKELNLRVFVDASLALIELKQRTMATAQQRCEIRTTRLCIHGPRLWRQRPYSSQPRRIAACTKGHTTGTKLHSDYRSD